MATAIAIAIFALLSVVILACVIRVACPNDSGKQERPTVPLNPHAHLLGKVVEAKVYEASEWELMVVVAVGWHGAVCVRPLSDTSYRGRWIRSELAPSRIREVM